MPNLATGDTGETSRILTGKNLVFIVGSPRSGTTWLLRLLACSPAIRSGSESYLFANYVAPLLSAWNKEERRRQHADGKRAQLVGLSTNVTASEFEAALKAFAVGLLEAMRPDLQPGQVFVEKTPDHALHLKVITRLFPECRIIHIVRDPRDVVASILRVQRELGWELSESNPRSAARLWVNHVRAARSVADTPFRENYFEVRYEKLLTSTEDTVRDILKFVGVSWQETDLKEVVEALKPERVRAGEGKPIRIRGEASKDIGRVFQMPKEFVGKATAGNWEDDLSTMQKFWVWYVAGKVMKDFGYEWRYPGWYPLLGRVVRAASRMRHASP